MVRYIFLVILLLVVITVQLITPQVKAADKPAVFSEINESDYDYFVVPDYTGDTEGKIYDTIQKAIDAAAEENSSSEKKIYIAAGLYDEHLEIDVPRISLIGAGREDTVIEAPERRATVMITADQFRAENISFVNPFGQEERYQAIDSTSDRSVFKNTRIIGAQDTLYIKEGRMYFYDSLIAGDVDYIYGDATAVFEDCEIRNVEPDGGYITAASTKKGEYGFLFLNCELTADEGVAPNSVYLGRPWRDYAQVTYVNSKIGEHIKPVGWMDWDQPERQETSRYEEYNSKDLEGNKLDLSRRVDWARKLDEFAMWERNPWNYLRGEDNWDPAGVRDDYEELNSAAEKIEINGGQPYLFSSLELSREGAAGTEIAWKSSQPELLDNRGQINRPGKNEKSKAVTLTALVKKGDKGVTREFDLVVMRKPAETAETGDQKDCFRTGLVLEYLLAQKNLGSLTEDISLPEDRIGEVTVNWESTIPYLNSEGEVFRPSYQDGDSQGKLKAQVKKNDSEQEWSFPVTILKTEHNVLAESFKQTGDNWNQPQNWSVEINQEDIGNNTGKKGEFFVPETVEKVDEFEIDFPEKKDHILLNSFRVYLNNKENQLTYNLRDNQGNNITQIEFNTDNVISVFDGPESINAGDSFGWPIYDTGNWYEVTFVIDNRKQDEPLIYDLYLKKASEYQGPYRKVEEYLGLQASTEQKLTSAKISSGVFRPGSIADTRYYVDDYIVEDFTAYVEETLEDLTLEKLGSDADGQVNSDLELPEKGIKGVELNWSSNKPEIISSSGEFDLPDGSEETQVVLTVEAVKRVGQGEDALAEKREKKYELLVKNNN
ncbi:MAG: pectinesterase family protein [Bacillota bacterium]